MGVSARALWDGSPHVSQVDEPMMQDDELVSVSIQTNQIKTFLNMRHLPLEIAWLNKWHFRPDEAASCYCLKNKKRFLVRGKFMERFHAKRSKPCSRRAVNEHRMETGIN